tara:strand:+ start:537 stop:1766 length:1230 start_codon:yes stop_codon:yes gene_type:complete
MKICFFTENYYKGGLDTFLINLINAWPGEKDELTLVCNGTHLGLDTISEKINRHFTLKKYYRVFTSRLSQGHSTFKWGQSLPVRAFFVLAFRFLQYPVLFPWYIFTLALFFRRSDFVRLMVVNGGYPASLLGRSAMIAWRFSGKPHLAVMNFHNSTMPPHWYSSFIENLIDKWVIRSASKIVSVSKDCLQSLNSRSAFLGCTKLSYIYNGIEDPVLLFKTESNKTKNNPSLKRYCLMLGTYEARKGHEYLLQAFQMVVKKYPDVQLQIYGHGRAHEKQRVVDNVMQLKIKNNITLGDFTLKTNELLAGANILVVPSQSNESFGLTIIEAMAFGVPVVTTDVGGMPEVLDNSNAGFVCSKNNPKEFATAMENILGNLKLATKLGQNGRNTFEQRFMALTMAKQYESMIKY